MMKKSWIIPIAAVILISLIYYFTTGAISANPQTCEDDCIQDQPADANPITGRVSALGGSMKSISLISSLIILGAAGTFFLVKKTAQKPITTHEIEYQLKKCVEDARQAGMTDSELNEMLKNQVWEESTIKEVLGR